MKNWKGKEENEGKDRAGNVEETVSFTRTDWGRGTDVCLEEKGNATDEEQGQGRRDDKDGKERRGMWRRKEFS